MWVVSIRKWIFWAILIDLTALHRYLKLFRDYLCRVSIPNSAIVHASMSSYDGGPHGPLVFSQLSVRLNSTMCSNWQRQAHRLSIALASFPLELTANVWDSAAPGRLRVWYIFCLQSLFSRDRQLCMVEGSEVERKTFIKIHDEERSMQSSKEENTLLNSKLSQMFDFNIHVHETSQIQKASVSI